MDNHQDGVLKRIAFSQGLAVNVILGIWEQEMDDIKKPFESLSKDLVDSKKLWNIKKCKKHLGLLSMFRYRSNLESDLFDTDDFWEYPNLEAIYNSTTRHFEIESRRRILNKNIDDCENLLKNVENIVFHEKSWKLEWYIIILITIEIIINIDKLISIFWMVLENGLKFTGLKRNEIGTEKEISRR
uniref:DUF155 domain-containing protein n=1 Tax=Acrobeloides nanus TaxID=290746 RepID=A0A914DBC6_9BILA